jgi:hypothetical protein
MKEHRMTHRQFESLKIADFVRLEADVARLTQDNAALALALAQLREACLEDIGGRHDEIQCAICLGYWPIAGPPQHDALCILAADQPAAAAAELLAAADDCHGLLLMLADDLVRNGRLPASLTEVKSALERYDRARAGLRAAEGPG